jgi:hypothetical protein
VDCVFEQNRIDVRGGKSAAVVLAGNHWGLQLRKNHLLGGEEGDGGGFNGIGARWMARFVYERGEQSTFEPWLQKNAEAAWQARRASGQSLLVPLAAADARRAKDVMELQQRSRIPAGRPTDGTLRPKARRFEPARFKRGQLPSARFRLGTGTPLVTLSLRANERS